jgi:hypothetical protein
MSTKVPLTREEILVTVRTWPTDDQFDLAFEIFRTLDFDLPSPEERREAFLRLRGVLATGAPPPTDEEVQQILEEERLKKYA